MKLNQFFLVCTMLLFVTFEMSNTFVKVLPKYTSVSKKQDKTLSRIRVEGNKFVDENNQILVFKGLNTSDPDKLKAQGQWNKKYFEAMKSWGSNIVRFPIHPEAWRKRGNENYMVLIDDGIKWATELDMYVILDWHSIGNLRTGQFQSDNYITSLQETLDFWDVISKRYGKNNTVAFFEIFNELTTGSGKYGTCTWDQWKEIVEENISVIRTNKALAIPLVGGFNWSYSLIEIAKNPINAVGIGYVSHPYPQKTSKPWPENWTTEWGYVADKYPLILTEVGFCGAEDNGAHIPVMSEPDYVDILTNYCAEKGISYVVWVFDPHWAPNLLLDWSYEPTWFGKFWKTTMLKSSQL